MVAAPNILLRLRRKGREHVRVVGENALNPGLRPARSGEDLRDFAKHVPAELIAAVAGRLTHARQPGALVILNRALGTAPHVLGLLRTFLEGGGELPRPRQQFIRTNGNLLARRPFRAHDADLGFVPSHGSRSVSDVVAPGTLLSISCTARYRPGKT